MSPKLFFLRIFRYEFWPWKLFYAPLIPYFVILWVKTRGLMFPALVNTCLRNGGFFNENKEEILGRIPEEYLPATCCFSIESDFRMITEKIKTKQLSYPFVAKPVDGQRGKNVEIIRNETELLAYYNSTEKSFLIQEYIDLPIELAIFYSRFPDQKKGIVSSIASKEFLSVTGDGVQSIGQLLKANPRARLIWKSLIKNTKADLQEILQKGRTIIVEPIGNHCRGTVFRNSTEINKAKVALVIDNIMLDYTGFNYGRFDLKVRSIDALYDGKNIKILELNGVNADPAHIFDPEYRLLTAYRDVIWHWKRLSEIAMVNRKNGHNVNGAFPF